MVIRNEGGVLNPVIAPSLPATHLHSHQLGRAAPNEAAPSANHARPERWYGHVATIFACAKSRSDRAGFHNRLFVRSLGNRSGWRISAPGT